MRAKILCAFLISAYNTKLIMVVSKDKQENIVIAYIRIIAKYVGYPQHHS